MGGRGEEGKRVAQVDCQDYSLIFGGLGGKHKIVNTASNLVLPSVCLPGLVMNRGGHSSTDDLEESLEVSLT